MAEYYLTVPLDSAPTQPRVLQETVGVPITGVIINGALPPGTTFRICRKGSPSGIILGDFAAITDLFCPPVDDGLAILFTPATAGGSIEIVALSQEGGVVTR
jgi:hypothetical protein